MLLAFVLAFSLAAPTTAYADDGNSSGFDPLGAIASFFGVGDSAETYAVENADTVKVDPDTTNQWTNHTAPGGVTSTQNVGRIWTDKSVFNGDYSFSGQIAGSVGKGSSDFLVSLSALSSTSNVRETVTTTEPLDIVLVLDDSGSMDEYMTMEGRYIEVPADEVVESTGHLRENIFGNTVAVQDTTGGEYYALVNGDYERITEVTNRVDGSAILGGSYNEHVRWELNGQEVTPEITTFYRYEQGGTITRTEALQNAVNSFIDQTATLNGSIENQEDKIRISIVVFEDSATTENGLTVCEGNNVNTLKRTVSNLRGDGATNAGAGMRNANNVLSGSDRPNANQVVIFFTDGVPTTQSSFSQSVANTAVENARAIKNRGGMVYSIGIFNGADPSQTEPGWNPSETRQANVFMNAVSSNYPNSSAWDNLGDRAQGDPDYYKATSDAGELATIFDEIFDETTSNIGSGSPIEEVTTGGANNTPGNLVFTDQLGSYMEVTGTGAGADKMQIAYGDQLITSNSRDEARNAADNATIYTYHFSGTVEGNEVYHEANLADFSVVVTHYDDPTMGDQVTVTIPASLIPMRNYDVNTDNNTMTVSEAYPVRLFYGVSIKADVQAVLDDPTSNPELYSEVVKANASADGQTLDFYSNAYNGGTDGATTSTFTPSDSNRFYYYTEDEQLYLDEGCTRPATRYNIDSNSGTLYYQDTYWQQGENGAASQETEHIGIKVSGSDLTFVRYDGSGNAYIPSGTQRLDRPNTLTSAKDPNNTETATNVLHPEWSGNNVTQNLGNNGKMSFELPGDLVITKNIDWGNASDQTKENQKNFTFQVNFNGDEPLDGNFAYEVYGSGEDPVSNGTIADNGTVTIEAGQRVVITGLPAGTTYTVTEQGANSNGFTTTDNSVGDGANTADGVVDGMIVGGSQQSATFTNTYNASTPVNLSADTTLSVQKVLDGRDWRDDDSFTFNLSPVQNAPASSKAEVVITDATGNNHTDSFGDITFTAMGAYRYTITEVNDDNPIVGIDYSAAVYRVTVNVVDGGNGNLAIGNVSIEQLQDDEGAESADGTSGVQGSTVTFTNRYLSDQGSTTIDGTKVYDDTTGGNNIDANKFTFRLEALGGYDTGNKPGDGSYTYAAGETPMPAGAQDNAITTGNSGNEFHFPTIYFDGDDVGRTYEYKVTEVAGNEQGMEYDDAEYTLLITVTEEHDGQDGEAHAHIVATPNIRPTDLKFTNTYDPADATLTGGDAIHGTKVLNGRSMNEGETFYFQLTQTGGIKVLDAPEIATVSAADGDMNFNFSDMTFSQTGDYTFTVNEVADASGAETTDGNGLVYSQNLCTVTVHVDDNEDGTLSATVEYNNSVGVDNAAAFTNSYSTSSTDADTGSAEAKLTKVLEGKAWDGDSFTFEIKPESNTAGIDAADMPMPNADADGDGSNSTATVSAPTEEDGKTAIFSFGSITFDAPGTYVYKVTEVEGDNAGITYSKNEATITITVEDNRQGALVATVGIENNVFTNTYASELDYAAGGGLEIIKTFENADMREFNFTVTPKNEASADKLGIDMAGETFTTKSDANIGDDNASHAEIMVIDAGTEAKFTQDDADDTYTYTVQETKGDDASVTYDGTVYTVTITTVDDGLGGIKVTTTVTNGADYKQTYVYDNDAETENQTAVVPFTNTYKAEGQLGGNGAVSINATKTLTNRPMVDGEFTFNVTNTADDSNAMVTTGTNAADGTITFDAIDYSIDQMLKDVDNGLATPNVVEGKDTFTYTYKVTEDTDSLDDGVSAIDAAGFQITVTVTDNGDGTLGIVVAYPGGGDGLTFRNTYGESQTGQKTLNINGSKTLDVQSGNNAPDIEGKYTFTLTGSEGAPMPATTEAHNDAAGNVTFGDITFTMENVFGDTGVQEDATADETAADTGTDNAAVDSEASGESGAVSNAADVDTQSATRTKEFTYTVTESGNVPGVDNDAETSKTFTVTVTDNGDGSLSVESNPAQGALFSFTNTYNVDPEESSPTGEGGITITKNLDGRNLNDGEFAFELVDQNGTAVATGANDANGNVELGTVKFTEPGNFTYTIREAKGSLGGVDYDTVQYKATATVTDNGDGTLKVEWSFTDAQGNPLGENASITFNNTYTAQPTSVSLGTGKLIEGRALAAGEFAFKLADADGNEISTATNEENGAVTFDTITYDTPGDYTYTITEVAPQDTDPFTDGIQNNGVTYDESVYNATVKVTDNGKGNLTAQITYSTEDGTAPLFVNTYTASAEPEQGTDDGGLFGMAKTGDFMGGMMAVIAAVIAAAAGGAAYAARKMRRPRGRHAR